jgi:D-tyrosyl-tRNA(Tyr) deacylase
VRVVIQRVTRASVTVAGDEAASIGPGLLILAGIADGDDEAGVRRMAAKCAEMRLFAGEGGRFERSLADGVGSALVVSQFTLLADVRKGRRPSFIAAAPPELAEPLVGLFCAELRARGVLVEEGRFGAHMMVSLENDGPVTVAVDSGDLDRPRRG